MPCRTYNLARVKHWTAEAVKAECRAGAEERIASQGSNKVTWGELKMGPVPMEASGGAEDEAGETNYGVRVML